MSEAEKANGINQDPPAEFLQMSRDLQESKARLEEAQRIARWLLDMEP